MSTLLLENTAWQIEIAPAHGASVVNGRLRHRGGWAPVLRETLAAALAEGNVSQMASFLLAPYSNRLAQARFDFAGRTYHLRPNTPEGHVQHGDVRRRPWTVTDHRPDTVTLAFDARQFPDFNFPFPFTATVTYALEGAVFQTRFSLTNVGAEPMPAGFGFHPYFSRSLDGAEEAVELQARVGGVYGALIPTQAAGPVPPAHDFAQRRPLGALVINDCRAAWEGEAELWWPRAGVRVRLTATAPLRHLVVFTPPGEPFFAVEPVSNATNGFNLMALGVPGHGVRVVAPGESLAGAMALTAEAVGR